VSTDFTTRAREGVILTYIRLDVALLLPRLTNERVRN